MGCICNMIRLLDNLVLLKEIDRIKGAKFSSEQLKKKYPDKIVVIRHISYIYRDVLCAVSIEQATTLDNYIQAGDLVEALSANKLLIKDRIKFMRQTNIKLFEYLYIANVYFVKLDEELKYLFQNYQPFLASYRDSSNLVHCKLLGDMKIGFY